MAYTTIDKPSDYFRSVLWTGNDATSRAITFNEDTNMQPDWVWVKGRSFSVSHLLQDSVRGTGGNFTLKSDANAGDGTNTQGNISAFSTNGFTVAEGSDSDHTRAVNNGSETYVAWNWKAGGSASSNSNGSITSSVSASTDAGFSIVSYTGNGTDGATVGHGLTSPKLVLIKDRDNATPWLMYGYPNHPAFPNDGSLIKLNESDAMVTDDSTTELSIGSSTVTFVDAGSAINANSTQFIMYCFQEKKGYSKFSSYQGSGNADGPFVYTGFKPAWVMFKPDSSADWTIVDAKRNTFNVVKDKTLNANLSSAEHDGSADLDFLSNGFKIRNANTDTNHTGTIIYMTFAENPFVTSSGVPTTAR